MTIDAQVPKSFSKIMYISAGISIVGLIGIFATMGEMKQFYFSYLASYMYVLSIALGAMFFVIIQHLTKAGWSGAVRRIAENIMMTLPLMAVLFIPIILGMHDLFEWTHAEVVAKDPILNGKKGYLNEGFFLIRAAVYFVIWIGFAWLFYSKSVKQDETGDVNLTVSMERASAPAIALFALSVTFAAVDWIMSLDPHWFSTIFGVYYFAGGFLGSVALIALIALLLRKHGVLNDVINHEHYHDLGKLVFGFIVFWSYIAFSQYFLIWTANIPEETAWYLHRWEHGYAPLSLLLIFGKFVIPLLFLLSKNVKRYLPALAVGCLWILGAQFIDIYWLVIPSPPMQHMTHHYVFHLNDVFCLLFLGGLFFAAVCFMIQRKSILAVKDPRLSESLHFQNY